MADEEILRMAPHQELFNLIHIKWIRAIRHGNPDFIQKLNRQHPFSATNDSFQFPAFNHILEQVIIKLLHSLQGLSVVFLKDGNP